MKYLFKVLVILLLFFCGMTVSIARTDYSYDIGEPDENFNKGMTNASVDVSFDLDRDAWAIQMTFNATHNDGTSFTERDLFEWDGMLYLDSNNEVNTIYLATNGGGLYWNDLTVENGIVYAPFDKIKPDENGQCDIYISHDYIHLWQGHLIHRRTSNVVSVNYDKILKMRQEGQANNSDKSSDKVSSISGVVYDAYTKVFIEGATVIIGGDTSVTNDKGEFFLYNVKPGNVTISVTKMNYRDLKDHIEVFPDTSYEGVEIILDAIGDSGENTTDSEGYKEDQDKSSSSGSGIAVIGGALAGAGLLFFRSRAKKKKSRQNNNRAYHKNKKIEKQIKKLNPDYENEQVKKIEEQDKQLEKERLEKIKSMQRIHTDSLGTIIGKGIKVLLNKTKQLTGKVKKLTDKIQGHLDKIRNINLASYKGVKFKMDHLLKLVGDPLKKFTKIKNAIDAFHKKNLNQWAKNEIKELANVAKKLTDKINLLKRYKYFIENSKEIKRAINIHKEINVVIEVVKKPDILLKDNVASEFKNIQKETATVGTYFNEGSKKIKKLDKLMKDIVIDQTATFTNDISDEL